MRYALGPTMFASKKEAQGRIRRILDTALEGWPIAGVDDQLLRHLLDLHPTAAEKIGVGIDHFRVTRNAQYGKREFEAVRSDGTAVVFSYRKCFNAPTPDADVRAALRDAIAPRVLAYRRALFSCEPPMCSITGQPLQDDGTTHVDHARPTFAELADEWVASRGGPWQIATAPGQHTSRVMADATQREEWVAFHDRHANLRLVSAKANLSRAVA